MNKENIPGLIFGLVAIIIILICICVAPPTKKQYPIITENNDTIPMEIIKVKEFNYNGHCYIEFITHGAHCSIVHSPNCECNNK